MNPLDQNKRDEEIAALKADLAAFDRAARIDADPEEMRRIGYLTIEAIVTHLSTLKDQPTGRKAERAEMEALLRLPLPTGQTSFETLLDEFREKILAYSFKLAHPRFFAYIPSSPTYVAVLGDALATAANLFLGNWLEASAAAEIEIIVIDWFKEIIGMTEPEAGGVLTSGGSVANLNALAVARHTKLDDEMAGAVIYVSDQTHSCVERAARLLGFKKEQIVYLPTDDRYRLDLDALDERLRSDREAGRRPFCLVANAGTTNTGAVDDLRRAAEIAERNDLWFHIDAAYGGFAALSEKGKRLLAGIELADSVTLDPHKWLYTPFEAGCVLFREARLARATFHLLPDYLQDMPREIENINFYDYGVQLTRGFRALKLWFALRYYGIETYRALIERSIGLTALAASLMHRSPALEVLSEPELGIACFRYRPPGFVVRSDADKERLNQFNAALVSRVIASGEATLSSTRLRGQLAIRFCALNQRTGADDVERTIALIERLGSEIWNTSNI
jgi:aromatic-L-amino-acid decarboxylase